MATNINQELRDLGLEDLINKGDSMEAEYERLRMEHVTRGLQNPLELRKLRRDIARVNTEIRNRELNLPA